MHTDDICAARDFLRSINALDTQRGGALRRQAATPRDDVHAESTRARNHLLPDLPRPNQPESSPVQPARFGKLFLVPFAAPQSNNVIRDATVEREHEGKGEFGDGDGVFAGTV